MSNSVFDFLLNKGSTGDVVDAQAFSLTKVLSTAALILTPLIAMLVNKLGDVPFTSGELVVLIVAVLAFLAIVSAADLMARAIASAAAARSQVVPIAPAVSATLDQPGVDKAVRIIGARGDGGGQFLVVSPSDNTVSWESEVDVHNLQRQ